jgi:mgtE-like transporter
VTETYYSVRRIVSESFFILLIAATLSFVSGFLLQENLNKILKVSMLIALVPPINDMGGNIGCIVGSRMGTALHLGMVGPGRGRKYLRENLWGGVSSGVLSFGITGFILLCFRSLGFPPQIVPVFFIAGIFQTLIASHIAIWLALVGFKRGLDPDNVVSPIITSICDIGGVVSLFLAAKLFGI